MKEFFKNYKTTMIGIIILIYCGIGFWVDKLDVSESENILMLITSLGFLASKDADK